MDDLLAYSISYRVAMGSRAGQKVFTLQSVRPTEQKQAPGFSLHAGIGIEADAREKLERLCRYMSRPAVAEERLALTARGDVHRRLLNRILVPGFDRRQNLRKSGAAFEIGPRETD